MHGAIVSHSLGIYATSVCQPSVFQSRRAIRDRQGVRSAPANFRHRRRTTAAKTQHQDALDNRSVNHKLNNRIRTALGPRPSANNGNSRDDPMRLKVDDVICLAEQTREAASQENRRSVLEEAQKTIRHEVVLLNSSRPHSVIGMGLQALTSPMPLSAKNSRVQMEHIPTLLPLPSDRAFIPSPDRDNSRHANTPIDDLDEERSQSVARQCCEIMGRSMCNSCRKLERRLLNRERAERECPRMRISQQNIATTQVVKRFYPHLTESEIQDKIARGEIAKSKFLSRMYPSDGESESDEVNSDKEVHEEEASTQNHLAPVGHVIVTKKQKRQKHENGVIFSDNPIFALTQLKMKLKGLTSTPLFFTDLKGVQAKILSGEVDRKKHLIKPPPEHIRLKSAVSTLSTTSSNKSTLSKKGLKLSESLMPVFVSPRKVKIHKEPSYKVYYEPPLLSKRRQIPNPSFFAGSSEAYSLPERLPDIIEFADSKIKALEKQGRSTSSMSFASNISEEAFEYERSDPLSSSRKEVEKAAERDGEVMLGDSLSSSTPRTWLKSTNDVIDENLTGEEEHAKEQDGAVIVVSGDNGEIHGGQNIEDKEGKFHEGQNIEDNEGEIHGGQNIEDNVGEIQEGQNIEDNEGEIHGGQNIEDNEGEIHGSQNIEDNEGEIHGGQNSEGDNEGQIHGGQIFDNDEGEIHGGQITEEYDATTPDMGEPKTEPGDISVSPQTPEEPERQHHEQYEDNFDYDSENRMPPTDEDVPFRPQAEESESQLQEQVEFDNEENEDHEKDDLHNIIETNNYQAGSLVSENDKEVIELEDGSYIEIDSKDENIMSADEDESFHQQPHSGDEISADDDEL